MTSPTNRLSIPMAFAAAAALALGGPVPAAADGGGAGGNPSTIYGGVATVVEAAVSGFSDVLLCDTGELPDGGGANEAGLPSADVSGLLAAETLHAATVGQHDGCRSEASASGVKLTVAGNTITAAFLMARAEALAEDGKAVAKGGSEVTALVVNGVSVTVTGAANQTVSLLLGKIVINEQAVVETADEAEVKVTALRVLVSGVADVAVCSARSEICPDKKTSSCGDFVTGGGWIVGPSSGAKANFGVGGGIRKSSYWGHLNFVDHGNGLKAHGTSVTGYEVVDDETRLITGNCKINGVSGYTYEVEVSDRGEPGRDDEFSISLSNGYSASGTLDGGGNIQLHPAQ